MSDMTKKGRCETGMIDLGHSFFQAVTGTPHSRDISETLLNYGGPSLILARTADRILEKVPGFNS